MITGILLSAFLVLAPFSQTAYGQAIAEYVDVAQKEDGAALVWTILSHRQIAQYALNFSKYYGKHGKIDLADEVTKGKIPLFSQWDRRWGYERYGSGLLAMTGCGPTCLSMVYCGLTGDTSWNPYEIACMAEEEGYYVPGEGTSWNLMTKGAQSIGLEAEEIPLDAGLIVSRLQSGSPIICSMRPGDFTARGHFIVLAEVDGAGKILVRDPNSPDTNRRAWEIERLIPQIKGLWAYRVSDFSHRKDTE